MIHGSVTLDEVFSAAWARAASLVPETSGYLALAVGDATSRLPYAVEGRLVMLTTEGSVSITKRGEILTPPQAARDLRAILARLLSVATGTAMPSLSAAARPREESDRGIDAVIEEIEAALIPVNRSAARRALARLVRETIKARESGKLRRPSTRPPPEAPKPAVAAPPAPGDRGRAAPAPASSLRRSPWPLAPDDPGGRCAFAGGRRASMQSPSPRPPPAPPLAPPPAPAAAVPLRITLAGPVPALVTVPVLTPVPEQVVQAMPVIPVAAPEPMVAARQPEPVVATPRADGRGKPSRSSRTREAEPIVATPAPIVVTPGPVAAQATTPPRLDEPREPALEVPVLADAPRDPTPTWLGMAAVEMVEPEGHTVLDVATEELSIEPDLAVEAVIAASVDEVREPPQPAALHESTVLGQPTEDPAVAFELVRRVERPIEALTPPFPFEIAPPPRGLPVARVAAVEPPAPAAPRVPVELRPAPPPREMKPTRADDLLARFGASCVNDGSMLEAAACLRHIAGIDPTPPPARVELRLTAHPVPAPAETALSADWETPDAPRARRRRGFSGATVSVTIAALVVGVAGGGAVVRYRPDLLMTLVAATVPARAIVPALVAKEAPPPAAPAPPAAARATAPTTAPGSFAAPVFGERLGGTRAERGAGQRAR